MHYLIALLALTMNMAVSAASLPLGLRYATASHAYLLLDVESVD